MAKNDDIPTQVKLDHVGFRVDSLKDHLSQFKPNNTYDVHEVPKETARNLFGYECGPLNTTFIKEPLITIEIVEQVDKSASPIPDNHVAYAVPNLSRSIENHTERGFEVLSSSPVQTRAKWSVFMKSIDGQVLQLLSPNR